MEDRGPGAPHQPPGGRRVARGRVARVTPGRGAVAGILHGGGLGRVGDRGEAADLGDEEVNLVPEHGGHDHHQHGGQREGERDPDDQLADVLVRSLETLRGNC